MKEEYLFLYSRSQFRIYILGGAFLLHLFKSKFLSKLSITILHFLDLNFFKPKVFS